MSRRLDVDVAIIGGGLVGAPAALALRGMRFEVALLDKGFMGLIYAHLHSLENFSRLVARWNLRKAAGRG